VHLGRVPHDGTERARVAARPRGDTQEISSDQDSQPEPWVDRRKTAGALFLCIWAVTWIIDKLWSDPPTNNTVTGGVLFVGSGLAWAALALIAWRARRQFIMGDGAP
jgi:hypothetical protein